jgi:hypothetical protein
VAELSGVPLSSGTIAALTARAAGRLDGFLEHVREQIAASDVAGFDETGFRVEGRLAWVHWAAQHSQVEARRIWLPAHHDRRPPVLRTAAKHGLRLFDALVLLTEASPGCPLPPDKTVTISST